VNIEEDYEISHSVRPRVCPSFRVCVRRYFAWRRYVLLQAPSSYYS